MSRFFSNENWIWKPFSYVADILILSGMWFLCSAPLVTMGAATTALYDCTARCVLGRDERMFARFFRTFKREFVQSTLSFLLWAAVIGGGYLGIRTYGNSVAVNNVSIALTTALLLVLTVVIGVGCWVLPLLSRFSFGFGGLQATAVKLSVGNLPRTMLMGILTVCAGYVCIRFWVPFLFLPAVLCVVWGWLLEPVFRRYMPQEEDPE